MSISLLKTIIRFPRRDPDILHITNNEGQALPLEILYYILEYLHPHALHRLRNLSTKFQQLITTLNPVFIHKNLTRYIAQHPSNQNQESIETNHDLALEVLKELNWSNLTHGYRVYVLLKFGASPDSIDMLCGSFKKREMSNVPVAWALLDAILCAPQYDEYDHIENLSHINVDETFNVKAKAFMSNSSPSFITIRRGAVMKHRIIRERRAWHVNATQPFLKALFKDFHLRAYNLSALQWSHDHHHHILYRAILLRLLQNPYHVPHVPQTSIIFPLLSAFYPRATPSLLATLLTVLKRSNKPPAWGPHYIFTLTLHDVQVSKEIHASLHPTHSSPSSIPPEILSKLIHDASTSLSTTPLTMLTNVLQIPLSTSILSICCRDNPFPQALLPFLLEHHHIDVTGAQLLHLIERDKEDCVHLMLDIAETRISPESLFHVLSRAISNRHVTHRLMDRLINLYSTRRIPNDEAFLISEASRVGSVANVRMIREILGVEMDAGENVAVRNAVMYGHLDLVRFLINFENVDVAACEGKAFLFAARNGAHETLHYILTNPSTLHSIRPYIPQAIAIAHQFHQKRVLKIFTKLGFGVTEKTSVWQCVKERTEG